MKKAPIPENDNQRLEKLYSYEILDTENEAKFDEITEAVASICGVNIALISLVDRDRQWFKSRVGLTAKETSRDVSFCGHAILGDDIFEVTDAELDSRFCDNPLFLNEPHVRFYAGMPLITSDNFRLGTLCVIDSSPKKLSDEQKKVLKAFAKNIVEIFELKLKNKLLNTLNVQYHDVQTMVQAGSWELDIITEKTVWSEQIYEIYKIPKGTPMNKIDGLAPYASRDRKRLSELIVNAIEKGTNFDEIFEFYDLENTKKWVRSIGRPVKDENGKVIKLVGTFQDVSAQVEKEKDLRLVLTNITEGYFDWKIKEDYEYMSPRFWEILGYDYRTKKHHPSEWQSIIHPDDFKKVLENFEKHVKSKGSHPFCLEVRYKHVNGEYLWIKCEAKVVEWGESGEPLRMVGTHQDIHQEKIVANEASTIKTVLESHAIVVRTDAKGSITYVNDLFCEISKFTRKELLGSDHRILNSGYHPKSFFENMWKTIKSKNTWRGEIKNKAKDGTYYWVDTTIIPMLSVLGEIEGYTAFRYDITQRKNAEFKLSESNKYLDLALEGANLGIWDWYLTDNSVKYNERWAKLRGVELSELNMNLKDWESRVHPDDLIEAYKCINDYFEGKKQSFEHVHRVKHANGNWIYILGRGRFSEFDSKGKPIRFTGTDMDVTELISIKQKLEAIFKFSPVVVYECQINKNWTMNFISPYIEIISGYKELDFINDQVIPFAQIIHPDDQAFVEEEISRAARNNIRYSIEYRIIHRDGQTKWVWVQGAKAPDSNSLIGIISDITEKKKATDMNMVLSEMRSKFIELSLNKEAFFKFVLNKILELTTSEYGFVGEILEDNKGKFLKTFALTDISWDEATSKFFQENAPQGLEFRNLNTLFGEVIKTGKLLITNDAPTHPKAAGIPIGHPPLLKFMGIPIIYDRQVFAMVGVANSKNGYREEFYHYLSPFFQLLGEMIYSLKMSTELELQKKISLHNSKLASIGELAAGVGHEINNPLAIIQGQMEMLSQFFKDNDLNYPEVDSKITKSFKSIERIANIVKGLRSFARADDQRKEILNLTDLLIETRDMLLEIYGTDNISMDFKIDENLWVLGNRGRLQQVFVNILNNAKDAMNNSVTKMITVTAQRKLKSVEIKICDTGTGIPENIKDRIFDPFFTTKEVNKGTGIGLALVSSIIKDHEGMILVENSPRGGACFVVTLIAHTHTQAQAQAQAQAEADDLIQAEEEKKAKLIDHEVQKVPNAVGGKVLVVDDEEDLREILQDFLENSGFTVITASNGKEAFEFISKHFNDVDLIISDIKMPIMDGPEFARAVRSFGKYKGSFVFISGGVNIPLNENDEFVDGVLLKPFKMDSTVEQVKKWINVKKQ